LTFPSPCWSCWQILLWLLFASLLLESDCLGRCSFKLSRKLCFKLFQSIVGEKPDQIHNDGHSAGWGHFVRFFVCVLFLRSIRFVLWFAWMNDLDQNDARLKMNGYRE
jgi:hypothetical protein